MGTHILKTEANICAEETRDHVQFVEYINLPFELQPEQQTVTESNEETINDSEASNIEYLLQEAEDIQSHVIVVHDGKQFLLSNDEISKGEVTLSHANCLGNYNTLKTEATGENMEAVCLDDIMEEGELAESDNQQYAVLKDGQIYLQHAVNDKHSDLYHNSQQIASENDDLHEDVFQVKRTPPSKQYKRLVGKIIGIKRPDGQMEMINKTFEVVINRSNGQTQMINKTLSVTPTRQCEQGEEDVVDSDIEMEEMNDSISPSGYLISSNQVNNLVAKTLCNLMDTESFSTILTDKIIIVKIIHEKIDTDSDCVLKEISFYKGAMKLSDTNQWLFEQDFDLNQESLDSNDSFPTKENAIVVHITVTEDESGKTRTSAVIPELSEAEQLCTLCGKMYKNEKMFKIHCRSVHSRSKNSSTSTCDMCNKIFSDSFSLEQHRRIHKKESLKRHSNFDGKSEIASNSSSKKKYKFESQKLTVPEVKSYLCEQCFKAFVTQEELNIHLKTHDPSKQFTCKTCGKTFNRHCNLMRHSEIHKQTGKIYTCKICGCSYNFMSSLTRHIVNFHMDKQNRLRNNSKFE